MRIILLLIALLTCSAQLSAVENLGLIQRANEILDSGPAALPEDLVKHLENATQEAESTEAPGYAGRLYFLSTPVPTSKEIYEPRILSSHRLNRFNYSCP